MIQGKQTAETPNLYRCEFLSAIFNPKTIEAAREIVTLGNPKPGGEWGGVFVGYEGALTRGAEVRTIARAIPAPIDSFASERDFVRGTVGLSELLTAESESRRYYLGEFHSHPSGNLEPSSYDFEAIAAIANDPGYFQAFPILVIFDPNGSDFRVYAYRVGDAALTRLLP